MKNRQNLKILLLQARKDPIVESEELSAFARYGKLDQNQVKTLNVFETPHFHPSVISNYDALFVGGTSDGNVLKPAENPYLENCYELIHFCLRENIPVFASCYGFQMALVALGGAIYHQEKDFEMGTMSIHLKPQAKNDPVFQFSPNPFYAVAVHKQKAIDLPESCECLAFTDQCIHAFKVKGKPFWGFQFHPEVDKNTLIHRLGVYQKSYTDNPDHYEKIIAEANETPESNQLVEHFINYILTL